MAWRDMAVLTYRKAQVTQVVDHLTKLGIPAQAELNRDGNDCVTVLTMHSSKGLEFPLVIIPGIGELPYASHDANEQARVLYVGMTRAMNQLVMTANRESVFAQKVKAACEKLAA